MLGDTLVQRLYDGRQLQLPSICGLKIGSPVPSREELFKGMIFMFVAISFWWSFSWYNACSRRRRRLREKVVQRNNVLDLIDSLLSSSRRASSFAKERDDNLCDICAERASSIRLTPCGHICCDSCRLQHIKTELITRDREAPCPFCRGQVTGIRPICKLCKKEFGGGNPSAVVLHTEEESSCCTTCLACAREAAREGVCPVCQLPTSEFVTCTELTRTM